MGYLDKLIPLTQQPLPAPAGAVVAEFLTASVKDAPRNVPRIKARVVNRCTPNLHIFGSLVPVGRHEISIYKDQADALMAMVEDEQQAIKQAQTKYRKRICTEVRELLGNFPGTTDDLLAELDAKGADSERQTAISKVLTETSLSVEAVFRQDHDRDIRPLDHAEILDGTEHAEPKVVEKKREQDTLAGAMGAALAGALPQALEGLAARVADLLQQRSQGQGQGNNQGQQRR